ncbi:hypothetical protein A8L34_28420 [Bacillus sp. FJAT-27264]|uniref:hypothetical protein n=1 Tax=Paenibacillus sp. (strain DSM 101736 / FJAT-27264) TaxID=1850362 RepID=UPI000807F2F2|nr:hypothetical protein [Bacillus sp. FJAT-27264]OBZ15724.1 hypothetical protein A8L34_28420 [Bacillus sp. FJAT-27264]
MRGQYVGGSCTSSYTDFESIESKYYLQDAPQHHMTMAWIMHDHGQLNVCYILCEWAMSDMIKSLYRGRGSGTFNNLSITEQLQLLQTDSDPGLDIIVFWETLKCLATELDVTADSHTNSKDVQRLLYKTEDILCRLSQRVYKEPARWYQRVRREDSSL